ncbi:hypothetical protein [Devosia submarina]|uniref:hypothetical protein n=1 Tax=Devosia submarina TaxID=1173082 RepID=UPI0013001AD9|nr:hypothetical protein [Devosia submarina]
MTRHLLTLFAAVCCLFTAPAALADGFASAQIGGFTELKVGKTNILCYQEPCPWNGVMPADQPIAPHKTLWSGDMPPPLRGVSEDRAHIRENYREHCTLISGRFRQGVLEVAEILGPC